MTDEKTARPETLAAQALGRTDQDTGAIIPPVHFSTTYQRDAAYDATAGRTYIRDHGPTQQHAEAVIAALENGVEAITFASGNAACTAGFHALGAGDRVAVSTVVYHGVLRWLEQFAEARGLGVDFFAPGSADALRSALHPGQTKLVWLETPANPMWTVTDIAEAAEIAHEAGALLGVDSTCATPVHTRPLDLGADIVCHSATKFLNGHTDVLAGALVTNQPDHPIWQRIRAHRVYGGAMLGSMEAWLLVRGLRTLYLRVPRQSENALACAEFLDKHDRVEKVYYPGLRSFAGHDVAQRQMAGGFGAMLSFQVPGGCEQAIETVLRCRVIKQATSLGGVESLIEHRKTSEGPTTRTPENLIRMSVGIEHIDDLIADLDRMLAQ
ncbi:MAG: aminotransferase class V-fold PLP-dependent enzyme [Rhodospirillales bacterium]